MTFKWLGQAGFVYKHCDFTIMIDPYLSDSLAEKYKGKKFPHARMVQPPVDAASVAGVDLVLCTHQHTDHMDPKTLKPIHDNNKKCRFVIPAASRSKAMMIGLDQSRALFIDAYEKIALNENLSIHALPSAHEQLEVNENGEFLFLGFIITWGDIIIYHSGDCIPYPELHNLLKDQRIDIAFLPVNGRDAMRRENGIPGNFTVEEAIAICRSNAIPFLVCHHFGMFDFNTVDVESLKKKQAAMAGNLKMVIPELEQEYYYLEEEHVLKAQNIQKEENDHASELSRDEEKSLL